MQVIIQGLREADVFGSVIASAQASLSKDNFLASIERSNSTKAVSSTSLPSRKIGRNHESQATGRKIFDEATITYLEAAVPPLSPPVMDNDLMIEA